MPSEEAPARRSHAHVARLHNRVPSYGKGLHRVNSKAHNAAELKAKHHAHSHSHSHSHAQAQAQAQSHSRGTSPTRSEAGGDVPAPMNRSTSERNLSRNASTTSLRKNPSHVSLRRNRSSAEVKQRSAAAAAARPNHLKRSSSEKHITHSKSAARSSVHFDLGTDVDAENQEDGWTEASGSASPSISRSGSVAGGSSGRNSAKPPASAAASAPQSPERTTAKPVTAGTASGAASTGTGESWAPQSQGQHHYVTPNAKQITSRLLQRTPSHSAAPKMSSVSATATSTGHSPDEFEKVNGGAEMPSSTNNTMGKDHVVSRFVGSTSGTPRDDFTGYASQIKSNANHRMLDTKRVKSLGNLASREPEEDSDDERALAPRNRKNGTNGSAYVPPQNSRTQQKLWLQRASSNIEPMAPTASINGIPGAGVGTLVNANYDGRDPRVRLQLDKTGMEYLVVRRYQDPIGRALKRLTQLPGAENLRIPDPQLAKRNTGFGGGGRYGLSQSMRENRSRGRGDVTPVARTARSSYDNDREQSGMSASRDGADDDDNGTSAILRSIWDKSLDLSASA